MGNVSEEQQTHWSILLSKHLEENKEQSKKEDMVNKPPHYTSHPSGVECIEVAEHMSFCVGNAIKYLWRSGKKGDRVEDLEKALWYVNREIQRLKKEN